MRDKRRAISDILADYVATLSDTDSIVNSENTAFEGGLFTKPEWLKAEDKKRRNSNREDIT